MCGGATDSRSLCTRWDSGQTPTRNGRSSNRAGCRRPSLARSCSGTATRWVAWASPRAPRSCCSSSRAAGRIRGILRLGGWAAAAGHPPEAVAAFRAYSGSAGTEWATAGLAQALLATGDWAGARKSVAALAARRSPLAYPMLFRLARASVDGPRPVDAEPVYQELLGGQLDPSARAWVLMVKGEAHRAQGERDDARTQFELAQKMAPGTPAARQAALRQSRVDFELREFTQAVADVVPVINARPAPDVLLPALLLQGEAAYQA